MVMKPAIRPRLWDLRKNVRGALIRVEQFHPFIGTLTIRRRSYWQAKLQGLFEVFSLCAANHQFEIAGKLRERGNPVCQETPPRHPRTFLILPALNCRQYLRVPVSLRLLPRRSARPVTPDSAFLSLPHCVWLGPAPYRDNKG